MFSFSTVAASARPSTTRASLWRSSWSARSGLWVCWPLRPAQLTRPSTSSAIHQRCAASALPHSRHQRLPHTLVPNDPAHHLSPTRPLRRVLAAGPLGFLLAQLALLEERCQVDSLQVCLAPQPLVLLRARQTRARERVQRVAVRGIDAVGRAAAQVGGACSRSSQHSATMRAARRPCGVPPMPTPMTIPSTPMPPVPTRCRCHTRCRRRRRRRRCRRRRLLYQNVFRCRLAFWLVLSIRSLRLVNASRD